MKTYKILDYLLWDIRLPILKPLARLLAVMLILYWVVRDKGRERAENDFESEPLWKIDVQFNSLLWKKKNGSPRVELGPVFNIRIWQEEDDDVWEKHLWIWEYNDGDVEKAIKTWSWYDSKETEENNWYENK